MPAIEIVAHSSPKYAPRTFVNAKSADLTIALAVDYTTAGEKLTKKAAGDAFLALPLDMSPLEAARLLWRRLNTAGFSADRPAVVNVAGNGIYTLARHGWTQDRANRHLFEIFAYLVPHIPLTRVVSGGQTGIDLAGAVAAHALGVDTKMTLPAGFLQRAEDGVDAPQSPDMLRIDVQHQARALADAA